MGYNSATSSPLYAALFMVAIIFLMLKAVAKKAKSIVTLSLPKWRKRFYCMSYFICPKTASSSMGRLDRCFRPFSEVSLSLANCLYSISWWLALTVLAGSLPL